MGEQRLLVLKRKSNSTWTKYRKDKKKKKKKNEFQDHTKGSKPKVKMKI